MRRSKKCFKCEVVKPLSKFYKHVGMLDGHANKCIECTKFDVRAHREKNIERSRAYDRERSKRPERIEKSIAYNRWWRRNDRRRLKCHNAVARAIKNGTLIRSPCEVCGNNLSVAHHDDYDFPLIVRWLCQPCHVKLHKGLL